MSSAVTVLCADIIVRPLQREVPGRTRPERPEVLLSQAAMLRQTIETHGGDVTTTMGQRLWAIFRAPLAALTAALAAQAVAAQGTYQAGGQGDESHPVRAVCMAVHVGRAELRDGVYVGPALERAAHILSAGHGGQILLSAAAARAVSGQLPTGVDLRDLGEARLSDLLQAEYIYQLVAPPLPTDFPPLRTLDRWPHNLPVQRSALVGREEQVQQVATLVRQRGVRLVTLHGPGGTGKTRLALQVAAELLPAYADGVFVVPLAAITDPALVPSALAQTFGIREIGEQSLMENLTEYLREKQMLLVLDNFEQVVAAAGLVDALLVGSPGLTMLVTSRAGLRLAAERRYVVPPLTLPTHVGTPSAGQVARSPAVALFMQRAQAVQPDVRLTAENAAAIAAICHRLDGLPLALELAAARIKTFTPTELLGQLDRRLAVLTGGGRHQDARHQTVRGMVDWSYTLLSGGEQALFARLGAFAGSWTAEAAAAICPIDDDLPFSVHEGLASLQDKSLVQQAVAEGTVEGRYEMLETIQEYAAYALERLAAPGEAAAMRRQHAAYFLHLTETAEPELRGPEQPRWLVRLEWEHPNLRAALGWAQDSAEIAVGLRLAAALGRFWQMRGYLSEGRRWLEGLLTQDRAGSSSPPQVRARALQMAGTLAFDQGDYRRARALHEEDLTLRRTLGDREGIAAALSNLGNVSSQQGDKTAARRLYEESLTLRRDLGDRAGVATVLNNLGLVARHQGDDVGAWTYHKESLAIWRDIGDQRAIGVVLNNLGCEAADRGERVLAHQLLAESVTILRQLGDKGQLARALNSLADLHLDEGTYPAAYPLLLESLAINRELNDEYAIAYLLDGFAAVAAAGGHAERAMRLAGAAAAERRRLGAPLPATEQARFERLLAPARDELGDRLAASLWTEGQAMALDQAITAAMQDVVPSA